MASLRRNRTMPTDGTMAKFLYTILKQLDLKSVDWQEVANGMGITNGHAARMRFSRFKQQMEGTASQPRKARTAAPRTKKPESDKPAALDQLSGPQGPTDKVEGEVKGEPGYQEESGLRSESGVVVNKEEPVVKAEPAMEDEPMLDLETADKPDPIVKEEPNDQGQHSFQGSGFADEVAMKHDPELLIAKDESSTALKAEPSWEV